MVLFTRARQFWCPPQGRADAMASSDGTNTSKSQHDRLHPISDHLSRMTMLMPLACLVGLISCADLTIPSNVSVLLPFPFISDPGTPDSQRIEPCSQAGHAIRLAVDSDAIARHSVTQRYAILARHCCQERHAIVNRSRDEV